MLQESHIIPEFLYGVMYDEKHRYNVLSIAPDRQERIEQKGAREPLLCRECEQKFAKFERYASLVIKGGAPGMNGQRNDSIVSVTGIDYRQFKLFLLSLLWRAGVAKARYFERVRLGPHEERLRAMLRDDDPGPYHLYPCIFWGLNLKPDEIPELMVQPCRDKVWGQSTYHFVVPGLKLVYFVSNQRLPRKRSQFVLQHDGSLVFQVRSVLELQSVSGFMKQFESKDLRVQDGRRIQPESQD
ncbi:hypothetical protein PY254_12920 [Rhodanobacter sp. AS-Z3]|uniref:hypothetical protein n=1 Tax=Rhodanobacter sp. AS-Z3 TaxID=3031330 RepID=UPI00247A21D6|nr:hypothetical protein [Rhodanobacter sp. AS-Z3]WEN14136.1 hypothetical protein PY254_12920 [Rhodanobacter sp. AS-Z3]